jgi:hypothetical protein
MWNDGQINFNRASCAGFRNVILNSAFLIYTPPPPPPHNSLYCRELRHSLFEPEFSELFKKHIPKRFAKGAIYVY